MARHSAPERPGPFRQRILATCALACLLTATALAEPPGTVHPDLWPAQPSGILIHPDVESTVSQLLSKMTLDEKIGQMIQADIASITPDDLHTYKLGSILAGGNAAPGDNIRTTPQAWLDLTDAFYRASIAEGGAHRPIPILFGVDAVHGHAKIHGATIFPHNVGLGAAHDPALLTRIGRATAEEVSVTGIDWSFAPTIAVVRDVRWGRSYESYSEDPDLVRQYAAAMVTGLQGALGTPDFMAPGHTVASAKHFLGDGGTTGGHDQGDTEVSEAVLSQVHGAGYPAAIKAGVLTVMASYNAWQGVKMHANRGLLTDVLKGRFGFDGFVVGDWDAQEEIPGCTKSNCPAAIDAGIDMLMAPDSWRDLYKNTLAQARSGEIPAARIDDAVRRILRVKVLSGLLDRKSPKNRPDAGKFEILGSPAHRAVARQAVRESLVLLKNAKHLLPLNPHAKILVAGVAADQIATQAGGWTVDWQADHNTNADFPGATSIFAGIKQAVGAAGGSATLSPDGHYTDKPDAAIVVFGETPYAEYEGDRETLQFSPDDQTALALLRRLHQAGIPVVAVFLSGRPMWVNPELNAADAFVAAWLPGSEGGGVADVLFRDAGGAVAHDFTGKLGFSWPASAMPVAFDAAGKAGPALFARGFGLTDADPGDLAALSEDAAVPPALRATGTLFHDGHVTEPWSIYALDAQGQVRLTLPHQPSPDNAVDVALASDSAVATWAGGKSGTVEFFGRAKDLRAMAQSGGGITLRYRVDQAPSAPVSIGLSCGKDCKSTLDLPVTGPAGPWRTLSIALTCFKGVDLSAVDIPVEFTTSGTFKLALSEVKLDPHVAAGACP